MHLKLGYRVFYPQRVATSNEGGIPETMQGAIFGRSEKTSINVRSKKINSKKKKKATPNTRLK
jgi:hypothetical protein